MKEPVTKKSGPQSKKTPSADDVILRGTWDRLQYLRAMKISMITLSLLGVSLLGNAVQFFSRPDPLYYAATSDMRVVPLKPMSEPVFSDAGLLNWTSAVVTQTLTLDFLNFRKQLTDLQQYYTKEAFVELLKSLDSSGNLDRIRQRRLTTQAALDKAPVIIASGMMQGVLSWKIEVPVVVSYESSRGVETTQRMVAEVLVQRADTRKIPQGVQVRQLILR
ncbi:MAG: DotI/IcmL/TraM family protein [Syntrophotalea acetylenica]|nr:DotI/IcmL/TraM family protein [Syntrophotalea acetylenica]